jgi:hypothetical protein
LAIPKDVNETALLFHHIKTEKSGSTRIFLSNAPRSSQELAFWKVPRLGPFVFLARAAVDEDECGGLVEWNRQEKKEILGEKPVPVPLCAAHISLGLISD